MNDQISFAAQVYPENMAEIFQKGFKSVINNRPDLEGGAEQPTSAVLEEAARNAGIDYVFQPVVAAQITQLDIEAFARHYTELPKPILMFCRSGSRSSNLYQTAKQMDLLND